MYSLYAVITLILGTIQVVYVTMKIEQPDWLTVTFAVVIYLGTATGLTAASNTRPNPNDDGG